MNPDHATELPKQMPALPVMAVPAQAGRAARRRMWIRRRDFGQALRRGRLVGRTAMTTAMTARTHARAEGSRHHRTAGPTGAHAGGKWSWEDDHPVGAFRTARTKHAVVMTEGLIMPGDEGAGEEDNRHDENRAGDDYHPRRGLVEPRMLRYVQRRRRRAKRRRLDLGLRCLGHSLIMPTRAPVIKHRAPGVAERLAA
jgi:hypothetical protein